MDFSEEELSQEETFAVSTLSTISCISTSFELLQLKLPLLEYEDPPTPKKPRLLEPEPNSPTHPTTPAKRGRGRPPLPSSSRSKGRGQPSSGRGRGRVVDPVVAALTVKSLEVEATLVQDHYPPLIPSLKETPCASKKL